MKDHMKKIIKHKITTLSDLPAPSDSIMKIMLLLRNQNVDMEELVTEIEKTQTLVAQILKMINSGYYSMKTSIDTVSTAVSLLGVNNIKQLVYSASIMDMFSANERLEWNHSYSSSVLMTKIMKENDIPVASNLPITMLLHDIGKVVLRKFNPKQYEMAQTQAEANRLPSYAFEEALIQVTHSEAGAWLLETWDMTEDVILPIYYHHSATTGGVYTLETALVQLVNWVDNVVRGIICDKPPEELMVEAGIEEIDYDYWINIQRTIIDELENSQDEVVEEELDENEDGNTKTVRLKRIR